ncbi:hypothetical protein F5X68DRAFT_59153 [Plectosphaerella plurivora]|uniref:Secreted protein n=1 Tax=Plectosphaerella plurivora TaxID=936078 RepID=A0A9P8VJ77_9PEZI|nr:hypothetical protein F5X68DRAFT_59153 [Plectosphaerella plurivora]
MPSLASLITSVALLAAVANAVPTHHCAPGTSFFACGHYAGCFTADPCVAPPVATPSSTVSSPVSSADPACPKVGDNIDVAPFAIHDIFPEHPSRARGPVNGVHLETFSNASQVEQVVVFSGIPASAKSCAIGWKQAARLDRVFVFRGSEGVTGIRPLSGFPAEGAAVTHDSIQPFDKAEAELGALDFANWDESSGASGHVGTTIDCSETMYFKFALRNAESETRVYLGQDDANGWVVSYSC